MGNNQESTLWKIRDELAQLHKLTDDPQLAKAIGKALQEADRLVEQADDKPRKL